METARLRPHHVFCERFLKLEFPERGAEFREIEERIRSVTLLIDEALIEVVQGVDELCRPCPHCRDDRCEHPQGNEEAVRKWDSIIVKGLGISYGETRTSAQWRTLIEEKAPLDFCRTRCPSKLHCTVTRPGVDT